MGCSITSLGISVGALRHRHAMDGDPCEMEPALWEGPYDNNTSHTLLDFGVSYTFKRGLQVSAEFVFVVVCASLLDVANKVLSAM